MEKLIFNTSLPRSGSELLQVILSQNPNIYGSSTSPLLEYMYGARTNYELPEVKSQEPKLMQNAFISMCSAMVRGYYAPITNRPIVIDKSRGWLHYYEWVNQWNPSPKMICMVRDLRSIVASFERIYRKNRHMPIGPDNPTNMQNMTVSQRVNHWLANPPVGLALARTVDALERNVAKEVLFIKYEDLLRRPKETLNGVYTYIDEPVFEHDFSNITKTVYEDDIHFGVYGQHNVKGELQPYKEFDWIDVLPDGISNQIVQSNQWFYRAFNY